VIPLGHYFVCKVVVNPRGQTATVVEQVVPGVYSISMGAVNAFMIDDSDELVLIDTGTPGSAKAILEAIGETGRTPADLGSILVTHCHPDHSGSLAALTWATGAEAYMHPADAAMVRQGKAVRSLKPAPGPLRRVLFRAFTRPAATIEPSEIDHEVGDGEEIPVAGGIRTIHTPGHCAGQVSLLWARQGGVLFVADACSNVGRLGLSLGYENLEEGKRSLSKLARLDFEVACFGHGRAIRSGASRRFRKKWATYP
jgi:glyoxylase-like metal-dependent hydrolase (beta-lactamase superfamily II)